ncbi:uncharacterized protein LOC135344154 isoform X2 [Halichondria panicea]|uniref:uncharacterized protein LOC135344154 isoform X2 n=1 Tax=Halichondria panicea TaxID=6063 RepID=UPI00312B559C
MHLLVTVFNKICLHSQFVSRIVMASICLVLLTVVIVGQILADGQADVCNNGFVQLVMLYENSNEEYVQYCHDGKWHSLCTGGTWSRVEANVVCRQLGLSGQGAKRGGSSRTQRASPSYFMFGDTSCAGGESNIGECTGISYPSECITNDGWVDCQPADCTNGTVRLVGGTTIREGRVDVCTQGHWASVCYNEDLELADTVCKMLGFPMQGAMANSTTSSIDPKVDCTMTDDGTTLNCGDTIQSRICDMASLVITCQTFNSAVHTPAINGTKHTTTSMTTSASSCNPANPITSALGAVIGLLVLLEVGTVIAWVACTVTTKRNSSPPKQRILTQVNESYTDTAPIEPSYSSLGPNYNTVTTSDEGIGDYDVIDHNRPRPKPANPPPVKVEASKSEHEFFNAEEHMYAAINKKHATMVGGE